MQEKDIHSELSSIRNLMERSTKFISLSGMSGIMAGVYALIGACFGYKLVYGNSSNLDYRELDLNAAEILAPLFLIAAAVLALSLLTGVLLTIRQAKKKGEQSWNPVSQRLATNMAIPLVTGGFFILIMILRGEYSIISPACLLFYGLALIAGGQFTFSDVKWLGYCEIVLGLMAALLPGFGIIFWVIGFGLLHILYGTIMHFKYNQ